MKEGTNTYIERKDYGRTHTFWVGYGSLSIPVLVVGLVIPSK